MIMVTPDPHGFPQTKVLNSSAETGEEGAQSTSFKSPGGEPGGGLCTVQSPAGNPGFGRAHAFHLAWPPCLGWGLKSRVESTQ
jgi:hypothetical protein